MNLLVLLWIVVLVGGFWMVLVRPQRAARARAAALHRSLDVGDRVITIAGIYGVVHAIGDDTLDLEIAPGVVIRVARRGIAGRAPDDDLGQEPEDEEPADDVEAVASDVPDSPSGRDGETRLD